ncbi:MAG: orotate phosphoribosyltransferase [Dehalococcoidia bacterium]|nr:orotate phosphoribosyltransferase [Dehalococcoidia bacterium]HCU99765.1 orotate phosphoribosyltransferase [Dehalococcoidia bacterium]|tara:strand:- start:519 stop:1073 length:555 start_codon:yes stop_codon:yes gene_type:complete
MTENLRNELEQRGAMLEGHFQLASGLHADIYIEKFRILQWPDLTGKLCAQIANRFDGAEANIVAGPTTGGVILAFEVARRMGLAALIAERKETGGREFRRGFQLGPGDRVLVVDDVLTTGGSIHDTVDAVRAQGADVIGVGVMVNRGASPDFGAPLHACLEVKVGAWPPEDCALCREGIELIIT